MNRPRHLRGLRRVGIVPLLLAASMLGILLGLLLSYVLDRGDWAEWKDPSFDTLIMETTP